MTLPTFDLGEPGPHRDALVARVLAGTKTATSSLLAEWTEDAIPLPTPGTRYALVDSTGPRGSVEIVEVRLLRLRDVDAAVARAEGADSLAAWREAHTSFWVSEGRHPGEDDTVVVEFLRVRRGASRRRGHDRCGRSLAIALRPGRSARGDHPGPGSDTYGSSGTGAGTGRVNAVTPT